MSSSCCAVLIACLNLISSFLTATSQPTAQPPSPPQLNNITEILEGHSDYSSFSQALKQTQLDVAIDRRSAITVLVLDNTKMSIFLGQPLDTLRKVLSIHVLLQWHTEPELKSSPNKTTSIPTLWQASTFARNNDGFINVTEKDDKIMLGNGSPGSKSDITIVKSVYQKDYNISVLEISDPIVPGTSGGPSGPSPSPSRAPAMAPSPSRGMGPVPAKSPAAADGPSGSPAMAPGSPFASPPAEPGGPVADISPSEERNGGFVAGMGDSLVVMVSAWIVALMI